MKIKKESINRILLTLLFVLIYFTPNFQSLPHYTWVLSLLGVLVLLQKSVQKRVCMSKSTNIQFTILLLISVIFLGVVVPLVHTTFDFTLSSTIIGIILCFFRNVLLVDIITKNKYTKNNVIDKFIGLFLNACCVCVVFTLLFIVFPEFKTFWLNKVIVNNVSEQHANWKAYDFRYSISGFVAFSYASVFSFSLIMSAYILCRNKVAFKDIFKFGMICIGSFFYGRISIFAMILAVIMIVFRGKDFRRLLKFVVVALSIVLVFGFLLSKVEKIDPRFKIWTNWAFSFIEDIFVRNEITTHSVNNMLDNMYFLPEFDTFLIGDGLYTEPITGRYYMHTDVGYMRLMVYSGIIGIVIAFVPVIYMLYKMYKKGSSKDFKKFIFFIFITWLILEAKGETYFRVIFLMYPIFLLTLVEERRLNEAINQHHNERLQ